MTEPVIIKNSFSIGLVALLQAITPSIVSVAFLYFLIFAYGVELTAVLSLHGSAGRAARATAAASASHGQRAYLFRHGAAGGRRPRPLGNRARRAPRGSLYRKIYRGVFPPRGADLGCRHPGAAHRHVAHLPRNHAAPALRSLQRPQDRVRRLQRRESCARAAARSECGARHVGRRLLRRPRRRSAKGGHRRPASGQTVRPGGLRENERCAGNLHCAAGAPPAARDGPAGRIARYHGIHLLRAGHRRVRSDPGAHRCDQRHSRNRDVRDAVLRVPRDGQACHGRRHLHSRCCCSLRRCCSAWRC